MPVLMVFHLTEKSVSNLDGVKTVLPSEKEEFLRAKPSQELVPLELDLIS